MAGRQSRLPIQPELSEMPWGITVRCFGPSLNENVSPKLVPSANGFRSQNVEQPLSAAATPGSDFRASIFFLSDGLCDTRRPGWEAESNLERKSRAPIVACTAPHTDPRRRCSGSMGARPESGQARVGPTGRIFPGVPGPQTTRVSVHLLSTSTTGPAALSCPALPRRGQRPDVMTPPSFFTACSLWPRTNRISLTVMPRPSGRLQEGS